MDIVTLQAAKAHAKKLARRAHLSAAPYRPASPTTLYAGSVTVTESTAATVTSGIRTFSALQREAISPIGSVMTFNSSLFYAYDNPTGGADSAGVKFGFQLSGDTVEIQWRAQGANASAHRFWIWIDGLPLTAAPVTPALTVASGGSYFFKMAFAAAGSYNIRIYTSRMHSRSVVIPAGQDISPIPERPWKIACVGDSFGDTNDTAGTNVLTSWGKLMCDMLNAEWHHGCIGGTGFTAGTDPFGSVKRISGLTAGAPDLVVVFGGVNDRLVAPATVQAAATTYFGQLATSLPGVPVIMAGMNPLFYNENYASNQSAVHKAIRDAALAAPNVIGHIDPSGHAALGAAPPAYTTGANYNVGDLVLASGGVYQCIWPQTNASAGLPQAYFFQPISWYTGTGSAGTPNTNGNTDTCLAADGVHPTQAGQFLFADRLARGVAAILRSA
jgi:lysophospholipase L1-like esterase